MIINVFKIEVLKQNDIVLIIGTSLYEGEYFNIKEIIIKDELYKIYYSDKESNIKVNISEENLIIELIENKSYIFNIKESQIISKNWLDNFIEIIDNNNNNILGIFNSRNYIGEISLSYINLENLLISVKSTKIDYYDDFWNIINYLNDFCSELSLEVDSYFQENYIKDSVIEDEEIGYSKIIYLLSLLKEDKIPLWIEYIKKNPKTKLIGKKEKVNVWECYELDIDTLLSINENETINYEIGNDFFKIPIEVTQTYYVDTIDTQENYFVKFVLEYINTNLEIISKKSSLILWNECQEGIKKINRFLNDRFFKSISEKKFIYFNSQVLQKKYPYNKIFEAYNKIDFLTTLCTNTNMFDEFIKLGQKDVPLLYEYWVFIKIFKIVEKNFYLKEKLNWIYKKDNELSVNLKKDGTINAMFTDKNGTDIKIYYNKTYKNNFKVNIGSYSHNMQPDISLEFYKKDELQGIIHFDAKYKLKYDMSSKEEDINKMHTYNDAIFKTAASFIVYPGKANERFYKNKSLSNFPCVGAIPLIINQELNGIQEILKIIYEYINEINNKL